uniref:G_PROTEIN_RECEP_F1_2 domain-containing protein n=2 Tax=Bursaphelenchus xylophilus TaxID=6326 RepID=A0A1I7SLI1_BURXY
MPNIRPILMAGAVVDCFFSLFNIGANHLFIVSEKSLLLITHPIWTPSQAFSDVVLLISGFFVALSWLTVPVQYNYRLYIIKHGQTPPWHFLFIHAAIALTLSSIGCSLIHWVYYMNKDPAKLKMVLDEMNVTIPENYTFGNQFESRAMQIYFSYFALMSTLAIVSIIIADRKIRMSLRHKESIMGKKTKKLQAELSKALFVMAISPVFSSFSQIVYVCIAMNRKGGSLIPDLISSMLSVSGPLINSITTIYFVRPYRVFFMQLVKGRFDSSSIEVYVNQTHPGTITNRPHLSSVIMRTWSVSSTH